MAVSGGEPVSQADALGNVVNEYTPIIWEHASVPYRQFTGIDIYMADGEVLSLLSQIDDGSGYYGLYLLERQREDTDRVEQRETSSIYQVLDLIELPVGVAGVSVNRQNGENAVLEATISIGKNVVRIVAGEVYDDEHGVFRIVEPDETILLQLNGERPARY
ncbi:MAG: hypothetical protein V4488_16725 [Pseudomonadota bacterium]